jgi:hypothetical protein
MKRPRLVRALRIAFSAGCGIVAVLLVVLWVRSYWWAEAIDSSLFGRHVVTQSYKGVVTIVTSKSDVVPLKHYRWQEFDSGYLLLNSHLEVPNTKYILPYWAATAIALLLTAAPWSRWHLTFGTLLIATTLVAVGLGLIVWAAQ